MFLSKGNAGNDRNIEVMTNHKNATISHANDASIPTFREFNRTGRNLLDKNGRVRFLSNHCSACGSVGTPTSRRNESNHKRESCTTSAGKGLPASEVGVDLRGGLRGVGRTTSRAMQ